ncbi:MAG: NEW3 domain-containing protein [Candidatus Thermoplasmatota archaeon]
MQRAAVLAILILVAVAADAAVDPNPRATPVMGFEAGSTVTAVAVASTTGHVLAGRLDPGHSFGQVANANVWTLWNAQGTAVASGRADESGATCASATTVTLFEACIGDVIDVAISASGARLVIAAQGNSATEGRLVFIHQSGGATTLVSSLELAGETPTAVAMNADGTQVAVGLDRGGNPAAGRVRHYAWAATGTGVVSQDWATDTANAVTDVSLGNDGVVVAAAGADHYRFSGTGVLTVDGAPSNSGGTVVAVAMGPVSADHWSVAVTSAGETLLYSDATATTPALLGGGSAAKRAVAMSNDGLLFAAGDEGGVVWLYLNRDLQADPSKGYTIAATAPLDGAVTSLQFSLDGRFLAVGTTQGTTLLRTSATTLGILWTHATGSVVDVACDQAADLLVAAVSPSVVAFTALRSSTLEATGNGAVAPGATVHVTLTVHNTGNRDDTITLDAPVAPAGWTATLEPRTMALAPDATATAVLEVRAPPGAPPGTANVNVTRRDGGGATTAAVAFTVTQVHRWALSGEGALSRDIEAGKSARFAFTASNLGNGVDTTPVTVTVDDDGWTATVSPTSLSAGPGGAAHGNVTLTAPLAGGQLDSAVATIRLGSDATATLKLTATIGAAFGLSLAVIPDDADGAPGTATQVALRVTNTGNAPDTFLVTPSGLPLGWDLVVAPVGATPVVPPGASADLTAILTPASDASPGNYALTFTAVSQGDPGKTQASQFVLRVPGEASDSSTNSKASKGSPGLDPAVALLALAGLAAFLRRK